MYHIVTRKRAPTEPPEDEEPEAEKKERVIHTRVPESLEAELRERSKHLGISVSNLVRNVLGHAFGLVGDVVADSQAIARAARGDGQPGIPPMPGPPSIPGPPSMPGPAMPAAPLDAAPPAIDDVLGWQPFILGKNAVCSRCNTILPRGTDAAASVADARAPRLVICLTCLKELRA